MKRGETSSFPGEIFRLVFQRSTGTSILFLYTFTGEKRKRERMVKSAGNAAATEAAVEMGREDFVVI